MFPEDVPSGAELARPLQLACTPANKALQLCFGYSILYVYYMTLSSVPQSRVFTILYSKYFSPCNCGIQIN
jgi:hypothetical protein